LRGWIFLLWPTASEECAIGAVCDDGFNGNGCRPGLSCCSLICFSEVIFILHQWYIWGFSLAFSDTGSFFIGNLSTSFAFCLNTNTLKWFKLGYAALRKIGLQPSPEATQIPMSLYCLYELMFAAVTCVSLENNHIILSFSILKPPYFHTGPPLQLAPLPNVVGSVPS